MTVHQRGSNAAQEPSELAKLLAAGLQAQLNVPHSVAFTIAFGLAQDALAAGWRPPTRVVLTSEDLEELPVDALVTDRHDAVWIRQLGGRWAEPSQIGIKTEELVTYAPIKIVDEPASMPSARGVSTA